ncbi:DUF2513 domain-containing protein [Alterisphingorhabdus coralli]|uniref:DUF2513 domain-containing protein n=1 Tax=Alterisphingorhabdus coralli TaxID=3071408 RepID=A0AA97F8K5_9SPHN|nr:DUF2513 domain-containing protein [Parasphingorhabdus sp. SCSIO 66989]WOE75278.1 DUF2513 domain-containing protein [Parasphingorhabdus sp. SCSIO 66989]
MKRDMETIREMLLWMEEQDERLFMLGELPIFDDNREKTIAHLTMLQSAGFIDKMPSGAFSISWEGYEFLDKVRDPEIWRKTKDGAEKVGSWGIKLIGELASGYIKLKASELGLPTM